LVKLITGLYVPNEGEILLDGRVLDEEQRSRLVGQFSAVFNDACLFESLSGSAFDHDLSLRSAPQLERLRLGHAISGQKSLLGQAGSCSSGERKRVALLLAAAEERPMYVFDEFAADQDPSCKDLFYRELVPELKSRGKIVVVVTHDDRYFSQADHILEFERGVAPRLLSGAMTAAPRQRVAQ
jgi:putative ATP-binding cassette transporter